jgi:hypothetical protein
LQIQSCLVMFMRWCQKVCRTISKKSNCPPLAFIQGVIWGQLGER